MASLTVNPSTITVTDINQNNVTVNFVCDKTLTDVKLSTNSGSTYKDKISMTQNSATFSISGMSNSNYSCKLKGYYEEGEVPGSTPVTSVSLDRSSHTFTDFTTLQLTPTVLPANATNKNVTWASSDVDVATVSGNGLVTAKSNGTTTVTVMTTDGGFTAICNIVVNKEDITPPPPTGSIVLDKTSYGIAQGKELTVNATMANLPEYPVFELRKNGTYLVSAYKGDNTITCYTSSLSVGTHSNLTIVAKEYVNALDTSKGYVDIATSQEFTLTITVDEGGGTNIPVVGVSLNYISYEFDGFDSGGYYNIVTRDNHNIVTKDNYNIVTKI